MHRTMWSVGQSPGYSYRPNNAWAHLITPLTIWICVAVALRYGYFGDSRMVVGPNSSRLVKASSLFVEKVQVFDDDNKGAFLYSFSEKPILSNLETNWSVSNYFIIRSYSRKGFSLWLNQGSRLSLRVDAPKSLVNQVRTVVLKGEQKYITLQPQITSNLEAVALNESLKGKQIEYAIEEDDRYRLDIINSNSGTVIITLNLNISSKMYEVSNAKNKCSATNGSCQLSLLFPDTRYVVLVTPDNGNNIDDWYLELSFFARIVTYIAILGIIMVSIFVILKFLGACEVSHESHESESFIENRDHEVTETHSLLCSQKPIPQTYGTNNNNNDDEEDDDSGGSTSSSSEDLYDAKLCIICYDDQRNCFFVPCGHCATCYDCAQRIMEGESRVCPICRRLIHKSRRLFNT